MENPTPTGSASSTPRARYPAVFPFLIDQYEQNITHDKPRLNFSIPYANYLKIHYKNLKEMPGDEADGCEPDVSPFEIATQSWQTFDMVYKQTKDQQWINQRDHVLSIWP